MTLMNYDPEIEVVDGTLYNLKRIHENINNEDFIRINGKLNIVRKFYVDKYNQFTKENNMCKYTEMKPVYAELIKSLENQISLIGLYTSAVSNYKQAIESKTEADSLFSRLESLNGTIHALLRRLLNQSFAHVPGTQKNLLNN